MDKLYKINPVIWMVSTSFVLLQFFLQLSSGVVIDIISQEMTLSSLTAGLLSGSFYVVYTLLQIPVGMLCDRKNPKPILTGSALICVLGCIIFAASHHLFGLYLGRGLLAIGSASSFVCLTHLVRKYYPLRFFGAMIGISETLSFLVSVLGMIGLASMINHWGWRAFINLAAACGCIVAYLCWRFIPDESTKSSDQLPYVSQVKQVLSLPPLWINGLFIGFTFMLVSVFGALWAPPFLQAKLSCTVREAGLLDALFILGAGISCPLFGYLANVIKQRKQLIASSCLATTLLLLLIIYLPTQNIQLMAAMMLTLGLVSGSYILGYTFSNEFSPSHSLSTSTGMTNTLALLSTPILQPLIGYMLDNSRSKGALNATDYQHALVILPICILIATILVIFLPLRKNNS